MIISIVHMWINFLDSYKNQRFFIQRASAFQILKLLAEIGVKG